MPPESQDAQSAQDVEVASTPSTPADQPTTEKTSEKTVLDFLDIPAELQGRLAPKAEEAKPEPEPELPEPNKKDEEPEELEPDEDAEPEEEPTAEQQPQRVDKRLKRINRLTRKKAELESQLDNVAAENYKLRQALAQGQQPAPQAPALTGGRLADLQTEIDKCDAMLAWCDANSAGAELGEGADAQYYDEATVKSWRRNAETARQEKVVEKREELWNLQQARKQSDQSAYQLWPEMFDKRNPEFQEAVAIIRQYPFLQALPEANLVLGTFLEGRKKLKEKLNNGNGQVQKQHRDLDERVFTTPRVPIAPHAPEPPTRESNPSSQKTLNEAMSRLAKDSDGSSESLAGVFAALQKAQRSRPSSQSPVRS